MSASGFGDFLRTEQAGEEDTVMNIIRCDERDIVKVIEIGRLRWLGLLFRMRELDPCRRLTLLKPEGTRRVGKLQLRWLESGEEDRKKMGGEGDWRLKSQDREQWRTILEEAKVRRELKCQKKKNKKKKKEKEGRRKKKEGERVKEKGERRKEKGEKGERRKVLQKCAVLCC